MPARDGVPETEIFVGYGSLLSKKGITREGSAPTVHRAWAMLLPGRRGFSHPARGGRKMVMDAHLEEAKVLAARALPGFVEGAPPRSRSPQPFPWSDTEPSFEGLGIEIDRGDLTWLDAREEFPPGLAAALAVDAESSALSIAAHLGRILSRAGVEGYAEALHDQYRTRLDDPDPDRFHTGYIPYPVHLPERDDRDVPLEREWGIVCAVPRKAFPAFSASEASAQGACDPDEFRVYYLDCVLGAAHGLDTADLRDEAYEATVPDFARLLDHYTAEEGRPLSAFLGPPAGERREGAAQHGMHPVVSPIALAEALDRLHALRLAPRGTETVAVEDAQGRVLAGDVLAPFDVPEAPKSAMDGYAVRAEDTFGAGSLSPRVVKVVGESVAGGDDRTTVRLGTCVQIATGALLPEGADAVVMVEMTDRDGDTVSVYRPHRHGQNVHQAGSDFRRGDVLVAAGRRLGPGQLAGAAAAGAAHLVVHARPRVAVVATGDEVVPLGTEVRRGAVYDSNSIALAALATRMGAEVTRFPPVADDEQSLGAFLDDACARFDLVLLSGGTSAGPRDLLADLVGKRGEILFHGVRVRPGKPVLAATVDRAVVLGLPGYPASCLLTAELFAVPVLSRLAGDARSGPIESRCLLTQAVESKEGWVSLVTVALDPHGRAVPTFHGSAAVTTLSGADGYFLVPEPTTEVHAGADVLVRRFH